MTLVVVGVSHRTAPLDVREALAFPRERISEALARARAEAGLEEAMILSTCNRVEVYGRAAEGAPADAVARFLEGYHGRAAGDLGPYVYAVSGEAAVRHAFRVAASLDSMVIGEPQILGQVKEAYEIAEEAKSLGASLGALRNRSLSAAKRARSETRIGQNAVSVSSVAVELARKIFGSLKDRSVLLVGAGKMSELSARHLVSGGARATVLGGRTFEKAEELAAALGGQAAPFEALQAELAKADVVISSTGAPHTVIHKEDVAAAVRARRRPLFLIDIAVPRDVEPDVRELANVFLYDLDDLKAVADANLRERKKEAASAEAIVESEVRAFLEWQKSLDVAPLLADLRQRAEAIRRAELERARKRLGPLTAEQESAIDAATSAIVNKLLHPPTAHLKEVAKNGSAPDVVELVRRLFGL
ncbi:MAG TPA: glutamyl-tRNA reductase [Vicinamibacteria bacterium]|nr:glutamyl-tRNA reductase [Vicinamibacteria bacterium]